MVMEKYDMQSKGRGATRPGDTTSRHRQQLGADGSSAPRMNPRQAPQGDAARRPRSPQSRKR